jgi:glycosyltransferase involved in cell wall biosynthesis
MSLVVDFERLRVAVVGPLPPPAGGMANQTRQLAALLQAANAQVAVVQTNAPYRPAMVGKVPMLRALFRLLPYFWALWRAAGRADVVHVMANSGWSWHLFAAPAIWVARLRGRAVIVNYRGGEAQTFLARSGGLVAFSLRLAQRLVVPSGFLEAVFGRHGLASQVVPNIVDLALFQPASAAQPPALRGRTILVTRNLEPIYGNDTALRALAIVLRDLPQVRMLIAGSGPEEGRLKALASELGVAHAVQFLGRLSREEVAAQLQAAAVSLNASRVDNMPNSVLEAMAASVPVVSTDVGGVPFIAEHGVTALLVPADDAQAMASALMQLLTDPALGQRLATQARAVVADYSADRVMPQWRQVYLDALAANSQRSTVPRTDP